mmetsp:Transcript_11747/g.23402  ORF Transcript_11747/g.23402 Transcript_11747/m.23402 type:complete len:100 (+) Transcript_11747:1879-2178(+)
MRQDSFTSVDGAIPMAMFLHTWSIRYMFGELSVSLNSQYLLRLAVAGSCSFWINSESSSESSDSQVDSDDNVSASNVISEYQVSNGRYKVKDSCRIFQS